MRQGSLLANILGLDVSATAHLGGIGDRLTIMSFGWYTPVEADAMQPAVLLLDESNRIIRESGTTTG